MGTYKNTNGVLTPIAGRSKVEYGASIVKTGHITMSAISANSYQTATVTFDTPMPDADYMVFIKNVSSAWLYFDVYNVTKNGFVLYLIDGHGSGVTSPSADYVACKPYIDTEYNDVLQLARPDLWPLDTEIAFENGLYGMHKAGSVTLSANTQYDLTVVPKSAGLTTTAKFVDRGGWWQASTNYKYFMDVNWGSGLKTCYWLDRSSGKSDTPCIRLAFMHSNAGTYDYDTWVTYTKS